MEYLLRFLVSHLKQYVRDNWDGERNKNWLIQKYTLLIITLYVAMAASHALYRLKSKYANTSWPYGSFPNSGSNIRQN